MKRLLLEPLVHFLVLGGLLFAAYQWHGGPTSQGSSRIVVTRGTIERLTAGFEMAWQRPPTDAEIKGLVDDYVREELSVREALALGLDRDDTIIRRRLRQKLEFLMVDAQAPPSDAELQAWLERHPTALRTPTQLSLRQVFVSPRIRGARADADAQALLVRLQRAGAAASSDGLGDPSMLPSSLPLGPLAEVERAFGPAFAARVGTLSPGQWIGPIESPFGLHLVLVGERMAAAPMALSEVRSLVASEVAAERHKQQVQRFYDKLLEKHEVVIGGMASITAPEGAGEPTSPSLHARQAR